MKHFRIVIGVAIVLGAIILFLKYHKGHDLLDGLGGLALVSA